MPLKINAEALNSVIRMTEPVARRNKGSISLRLAIDGGRVAAVDSLLTMFVETGFPISATGNNGEPLTTGSSLDRLRGLSNGQAVSLSLPRDRSLARLPKITAKAGRSSAKIPITEPEFSTPRLESPKTLPVRRDALKKALAVATIAAAGSSTSDTHGVHIIANDEGIGVLGTDGARLHYARIGDFTGEPLALLIGKQQADSILGLLNASESDDVRVLLWGNPVEWVGAHVASPLPTAMAVRCKPSAGSILNWRNTRPGEAGAWSGQLNRDRLRASLEIASLYVHEDEPRCVLSLSADDEQQISAFSAGAGEVVERFDADAASGVDVSKAYNVNYLKNAVLAVDCDVLDFRVPGSDRALWIRPADGREVECLVMPFAG